MHEYELSIYNPRSSFDCITNRVGGSTFSYVRPGYFGARRLVLRQIIRWERGYRSSVRERQRATPDLGSALLLVAALIKAPF